MLNTFKKRSFNFGKRFITDMKRLPDRFNREILPISNDNFDFIVKLNEDKDGFKKLGPPIEPVIYNNTPSFIYAGGLFRLTSRFGRQQMEILYQNILDLEKFMEFVPSQEEFDKTFKTRKCYYDDEIDESENIEFPKEYKYMEYVRELRKEKNVHQTYSYHKDFIYSNHEGVKKSLKHFNTSYTYKKSDLKEDMFLLHPHLYSTIEDIISEQDTDLMSDFINDIKKLLELHLGKYYVEILTAKPPSTKEKKMILNFVHSRVNPEDLKNTTFKFIVDPTLISGFSFLIGENYHDYSFQSAMNDI